MEIKNRSLRSFEGAMKHCSIFGLGGHGRVVIDAAETQKIRCFGFDDNFQKIELLTKNIAIGGNYDDFVKSKKSPCVVKSSIAFINLSTPGSNFQASLFDVSKFIPYRNIIL